MKSCRSTCTCRVAPRDRSRSSTAYCNCRRRSPSIRTSGRMGEPGREVDVIRASVPDAILEVQEQPQRGMFWLNISPSAIVEAATVLRDHPELDYKMLCDLFGVDYPARD